MGYREECEARHAARDWIKIEDRQPAIGDYIWAEIEYMGKIRGVDGKVIEGNYALFDFYSGTNAEKIIRWCPRIPSRKDGHPWAGISRGVE